MKTVLVGEFGTRQAADRAVEELTRRGFRSELQATGRPRAEFSALRYAALAAQGAFVGMAVSAFGALILPGPMIPVVMAGGAVVGALLNVGLSERDRAQSVPIPETGPVDVMVYDADLSTARAVLAKEGAVHIREVEVS
jgi:hypothetical protein